MKDLLGEVIITGLCLGYSLIRLTMGLIISILLSLAIGILAARNKSVERVIIPLLDVLQSVPILGFFPAVVYLFIYLNPYLGAELAAIVLIVTSQMWNLTFGVYEAIKTLPKDLLEVSEVLKLNLRYKILKLYCPVAIPKIASNIFPSWANGFFFLAASEIISLGNVKYELKGIGSRIVRLIANNDYMGLYIALTFSALLSVLLTELIFRPLLIWSEKYKLETIAKPMPVTEVWLGRLSLRRVRRIGRRIALKVPSFDLRRRVKVVYYPKLVKGFSSAFKVLVPVSLISFLMLLIIASKDFRDALMLLTELNYLKYTALALIYSTLRILATSLLTMCWIIPLAFYLYFRPKLERLTLLIFQVLASIPAPLFYPVILKVFKGSLIELGVILMLMLASQWYLFYNIYDGLKRFPYELEEVLNLYRVKGLYKLKVALVPAIMPSLFTGLVTFIGGCWNALVIAEELRPGVGVNIGIGKELISYTNAGYLPGLYATLLIMVLFIMGLNKGLWRPLRDYIMNRFSYEA